MKILHHEVFNQESCVLSHNPNLEVLWLHLKTVTTCVRDKRCRRFNSHAQLSSVLFELLCGRRKHCTPSPSELAPAVMRQNPVSSASLLVEHAVSSDRSFPASGWTKSMDLQQRQSRSLVHYSKISPSVDSEHEPQYAYTECCGLPEDDIPPELGKYCAFLHDKVGLRFPPLFAKPRACEGNKFVKWLRNMQTNRCFLPLPPSMLPRYRFRLRYVKCQGKCKLLTSILYSHFIVWKIYTPCVLWHGVVNGSRKCWHLNTVNHKIKLIVGKFSVKISAENIPVSITNTVLLLFW